MPVARSDPRRATVIGIAGVIVGVAMIVLVLVANNAGSGGSHSSRSTFEVGPADASAKAIERDDTPLLFQDPATFSRPVFVQHLGTDPSTGWFAFDAAVGSCVVTWHKETHDFAGCDGRRYPADGTGLHQYPVTVRDGNLTVDLDVDATTTSMTPLSS